MESGREKMILTELAAIEAAALSIMRKAAEEKTAAAEEAKARQEAFDAELDRDTGEKIETIRRELAEAGDAEIAGIRAEFEGAQAALHDHYEQQMDARAEEIVRGILEAEEKP